LFRVGIVSAQNVATGRVRVTFPDRNQLQSWLLAVVVPKTQNDKAFWMPDIGDQVVCLMDEQDEDGAVLGAIYSTVDAPPAGMTADKLHWTAKDGATFEYDRAAHALAVALPSGGTLSITANGATLAIDAAGNVTVQAAGDIKLKTGIFNDSVNTIISTYNGHTHPDPQGGNTGVPNQVLP
jgi:phage baseplate assembly protein V